MDADDIDFEIHPYVPSSRRSSIHVESSQYTNPSSQLHLQRLVTFLDKPNLKTLDKSKKNHENELEKSPFDAFRRVQTYYQAQTSGSDLPMGEFYRQRTSISQAVLLKEANKPVVGGNPITFEVARDLRQVVLGTCIHRFPREWRDACFTFQNIDGSLPYGLMIKRNCVAGLLVSVQGVIMRRLIYKNDGRPDLFSKNCLRPTALERKAALVWCLSHILWQAGEQQCFVCLPQDKPCFKSPGTKKYHLDNITEMLHIFEFRRYEDLENFLKRFLSYFESESSHGVILFLYSLVLSRSISRLRQDFGGEEDVQLLINSDECSTALINLILTGKAVRHLHNGKIIYDLDGELLSNPMVGVYERSEVGYLYWNKKETKKEKTQVGSMLKTPRYPIWVTCVNGYYGLLFSLNPELVSHWRSEHHFVLHYYTGLPAINNDVIIHVNTRVARSFNSRTERGRVEEEKKIPSLDQCIMTKWFGANTDWGGLTPFV